MKISTLNMRKAGRLLFATSLIAIISACGGGSDNAGGGAGFKSDSADNAPYFSVDGSAVSNGKIIDVRKTVKDQILPVVFFDDNALKSYDITIDGVGVDGVVQGGNFSGVKSQVDINIDNINENPDKVFGMHNVKILAIDSANHATTAYFTLNVIEKVYYPFLSLVGSATPNGWDTGKATKLAQFGTTNDYKFSWTGAIKAGEFKITTQENPNFDDGFIWIHPLTQGQALSSREYVTVKSGGGTPDNKWVIKDTETGIYNIQVNQKESKIFITPITQLYMVGSATPGIWSLDSATVLARDPADTAKFSATVHLTVGEFKFSTQKNSYGDPAWIYYLGSSSVPVTESSFELRDGSTGGDNKWVVNSGQDGDYKITIDLATKKIIAVKQ